MQVVLNSQPQLQQLLPQLKVELHLELISEQVEKVEKVEQVEQILELNLEQAELLMVKV